MMVNPGSKQSGIVFPPSYFSSRPVYPTASWAEKISVPEDIDSTDEMLWSREESERDGKREVGRGIRRQTHWKKENKRVREREREREGGREGGNCPHAVLASVPPSFSRAGQKPHDLPLCVSLQMANIVTSFCCVVLAAVVVVYAQRRSQQGKSTFWILPRSVTGLHCMCLYRSKTMS